MARVIEDPDLALVASAIHEAAELGSDRPVMPTADSPAIAEIAREAEFAHAGWELPIENAHSYGRFVAALALEELDSIASIVEGARVGPSFVPDIVLRSLLASVTVAHWLLEPDVGAGARAARGLVYRLDSGNQMGRNSFIDESINSQSATIRAEVRAVCEANEWAIENNGINGEQRPHSGLGYSRVAFGDEPGDDEFDKALWNSTSATAHATFYAIAERIVRAPDREHQLSSLDQRVGVGAIVARADDCIRTAVSAFYGVIQVVQSRDALFGFTSIPEERQGPCPVVWWK